MLKKLGVSDESLDEENANGSDKDISSDSTEDTSETNENTETVKSKAKKVHIQRYKGLGEMNADELGETTMNIKTRILKRVFIDDAVKADEAFETLMGSEVAPRKAFIQNNAKLVEIDI